MTHTELVRMPAQEFAAVVGCWVGHVWRNQVNDDRLMDRKEVLDRWSQEHDRACAFLTCTAEGRAIVGDILVADRPDGVSDVRWGIGAEKTCGSGFVDVLAWTTWATKIPASGYTESHRAYCVVEVKTGAVVAGEVLRQLRRYEAGVEADFEKEARRRGNIHFRNDIEYVVLVLAHTQPLTTAALDLLHREGVVLVDLSADEHFPHYGNGECVASEG